MTDVYVAGVGCTAFGRRPQDSVRSLTRESVALALADAGVQPRQVGAVFFANCAQGAIEGQHGLRGQVALQDTGVWGAPIVNVENASASGTTAFHLAVQWLQAGGDYALAVGTEKLYAADKELSYRVFSGGWDVHEPQALQKALQRLHGAPAAAGVSGNPMLDIYAALCAHHMARFGLRQRDLALVSAKNHGHASLNPLAQYRQPLTVDEVLAARVVAHPFTVPMLAPIGDGSAAVLLARKPASPRSVRVRSSVLLSGNRREPDAMDRQVTRLAALQAYERAGIGPEDLHVAELHDASAFGEILQCEAVGLCGWGEGAALARSGATTLGGRIPVNPSGGLQCKGHPLAATGLAQVHEIVTQLRDEARARQVAGARLGLVETSGGFNGSEEAAACVVVLGG